MRLRIGTFNLENFDDKPGQRPGLAERIALMRPQLLRLGADVLCLQEANGQERAGQPRALLALDALLAGTRYADFHRVSTLVSGGSQVYDERNLVILSRFPIKARHQYLHELAPAPRYQKVTAKPPEQEPRDVTWERPILHAALSLAAGTVLHAVNVHLKSRLPSYVEGQAVDGSTWRSASGWAEGFFLSAMKRMGQALETRILVDRLFDEDEGALIVVCGDFNAEPDETPLEAIRGDVENTGNAALARRVLIPCELTIPEPARFSLLHRGKGRMIDHIVVSRSLLAFYRGVEIHNELLHDESLLSASENKYPESDHAPVVAEFELPVG